MKYLKIVRLKSMHISNCPQSIGRECEIRLRLGALVWKQLLVSVRERKSTK